MTWPADILDLAHQALVARDFLRSIPGFVVIPHEPLPASLRRAIAHLSGGAV